MENPEFALPDEAGSSGDTVEISDPAPAESPSEDPLSPTPGTKAYLHEQAKSLGIKSPSRMTKSDLGQALANAMMDHGGRRTVGKRGAKSAEAPKPQAGGLAAALSGVVASPAPQKPQQTSTLARMLLGGR